MALLRRVFGLNVSKMHIFTLFAFLQMHKICIFLGLGRSAMAFAGVIYPKFINGNKFLVKKVKIYV